MNAGEGWAELSVPPLSLVGAVRINPPLLLYKFTPWERERRHAASSTSPLAASPWEAPRGRRVNKWKYLAKPNLWRPSSSTTSSPLRTAPAVGNAACRSRSRRRGAHAGKKNLRWRQRSSALRSLSVGSSQVSGRWNSSHSFSLEKYDFRA